LNDIPAQRSDPSSLPISVDIHGQPSTSSDYSNIHMQRSLAQTNQEDAPENSETKLKEDRVARLSPLALRNRSRHDLNKPNPNPFGRLAEHDSASLESQELLSMEQLSRTSPKPHLTPYRATRRSDSLKLLAQAQTPFQSVSQAKLFKARSQTPNLQHF